VREALSFASGSECHQRQSRLRTCSFLPSLCCAAQHVKGQITFASSRFMRLEAQSAATCILRDGRPLPPSGPVQAVSHLARRPCCTTLHQTHDARWSPLVLMIAGTCPWKSFSTPICHHVFFFPLLPRVAYRLPGHPAFDVRSRQIVVDHATQVDWFAFNSYQSPKNRENWISKSSYVFVYAAANTRIHPVYLS
jgi:hypothetical protein